jgi:hypothetical protein
MNAKDFELDYFQLYDIENPEDISRYSPSVRLKGQFDEEPEWARLQVLKKFANPVSKNGEEVFDKNAHVTLYNLYSSDQRIIRHVTVANQFGEQEIVIYHAVGLLAPALKARQGRRFTQPTKLDHYKVYRVINGQQVEKSVKLEDQFHARATKVRHPIALAVPVTKEHYGHVHAIHNPKAHLVIYLVEHSKDMPDVIHARDQFGIHPYLKMGVSYLLAVPSKKVDWKEG